jgi:uncharacterized protein (TIGR03435 family)
MFAAVGCLLGLGAIGRSDRQNGSASQGSTPAAMDWPSFDVASLKPVSAPYGGTIQFFPGRAFGRAVTIKQLLKAAYQVTARQIVGAPNWVDADRFDFEARAASDADASQLCLMIRSLLTDRCHLAVRSERRESSIYLMTVGKRGLTLPEFKPGEPTPTPEHRPSTGSIGGAFSAIGTLETLADRLSDFRPVDRPVVNETGRMGMYLVLFTWSQGEDFIGALEDISGLKFEPRKALLDYYVIQHIEKPSKN